VSFSSIAVEHLVCEVALETDSLTCCGRQVACHRMEWMDDGERAMDLAEYALPVGTGDRGDHDGL
jgi:hypothetical protein